MSTTELGDRPKPKMEAVQHQGGAKVFRVSGEGPVFMPEHSCSHDAVLVVTNGDIVITYTKTEQPNPVNAGNCHVIPAQTAHTLRSDAAFQMFLTIPGEAQIKFEGGK